MKAGDRVAQLILERIAIAEVEETEGELPATYVQSPNTDTPKQDRMALIETSR